MAISAFAKLDIRHVILYSWRPGFISCHSKDDGKRAWKNVGLREGIPGHFFEKSSYFISCYISLFHAVLGVQKCHFSKLFWWAFGIGFQGGILSYVMQLLPTLLDQSGSYFLGIIRAYGRMYEISVIGQEVNKEWMMASLHMSIWPVITIPHDPLLTSLCNYICNISLGYHWYLDTWVISWVIRVISHKSSQDSHESCWANEFRCYHDKKLARDNSTNYRLPQSLIRAMSWGARRRWIKPDQLKAGQCWRIHVFANRLQCLWGWLAWDIVAMWHIYLILFHILYSQQGHPSPSDRQRERRFCGTICARWSGTLHHWGWIQQCPSWRYSIHWKSLRLQQCHRVCHSLGNNWEEPRVHCRCITCWRRESWNYNRRTGQKHPHAGPSPGISSICC